MPTILNPALVWRWMLAVFSGKIPAWRVQMFSDSEAVMRLARSVVPIPFPLADCAT